MISKAVQRIVISLLGLIVVICFLGPLYFVFNTSLKSNMDFLRNSLSLVQHINWSNYATAWSEAQFGMYTFNSLFYVVVVVAVSMLMAVFLAFPLSRAYVRFSGLVYMAFVAGMFLPSGMIPLWQMIMKVGLYNTRIGYMLTMMGGGGVTLFFFVAYVKNIPKEFDEAAAMDGCGYFHFVFRILIPLMRPAIASMAILCAIGVWNEILNSIIYLSDQNLFPVTRGLYVFQGNYTVQWPLLMAALVIVAAPMVILYVFLQKHIINGVIAGGVKE